MKTKVWLHIYKYSLWPLTLCGQRSSHNGAYHRPLCQQRERSWQHIWKTDPASEIKDKILLTTMERRNWASLPNCCLTTQTQQRSIWLHEMQISDQEGWLRSNENILASNYLYTCRSHTEQGWGGLRKRHQHKGWNCRCLSSLKCRAGYQLMLCKRGPTCSHWKCNSIL